MLGKPNESDIEKFLAEHDIPVYTRCSCDCPPGWFDLVATTLLRIKNMSTDTDFCVAQIKEKFGGLRLYTYGSTEEIDALINEVETLSYEVCQDCSSTDMVTTSR